MKPPVTDTGWRLVKRNARGTIKDYERTIEYQEEPTDADTIGVWLEAPFHQTKTRTQNTKNLVVTYACTAQLTRGDS